MKHTNKCVSANYGQHLYFVLYYLLICCDESKKNNSAKF